MNKTIKKATLILAPALLLAACGGGGSDSGGGQTPDTRAALVNECITVQAVDSRTSNIVNSCDFVVNVNIYRSVGVTGTQLAAGQTRQDQPLADGIVVACRAPSTPINAANGGTCTV